MRRRPPFRSGSALDISQRFELPDDVVGRLPRHANPPREVRRAYPVGRRKGEDGEMSGLQVGEARSLEVRLHAAAHVFETLAQQRADIGRAFVGDGGGVWQSTIAGR